MNVIADYETAGYLHVEELIPLEVARAFMRGVKNDLGPDAIQLSGWPTGTVLKRPAFEIYGNDYRPMSFFLWALTPTIGSLIGRSLLPTYDYFRIYREGDVCMVHADRPACEHSVSLTLDYSDGAAWDFQIAGNPTARGQSIEDDFGADSFTSISMSVGDAVIYRGVNYRHGRITPNPNGWSAHLFLHFVERGGPFEDQAFDRKIDLAPVNLSFC